MLLKPNFALAPVVKLLINIGALMDIPTGFYLKGQYGESILNGGLGLITGVVGIGNNFKSTIMNFMMLSAKDKIIQSQHVRTTVGNTDIITFTGESSANTYDTEVNIHEDRLKLLTKRFKAFMDRDIIFDQLWTITDNTVYFANEWYEILKKFLKDKFENGKKIERNTPFLSRDKITLMKMITPTFGAVDSFTRFQTEDVAAMQDANELGEAGGNTIHMRQGLAKMRFLIELPTITGKSYHYTLLTAHVGKEGPAMQSGPMPAPPVKKLQHLKNGDKLKGVTDQFTFLLSNCWHAFNAAPFLTKDKCPEFPRNSSDNVPGDMDLNIVSLRQLRGKSGPSGGVIEIIVSQTEGVLPELTEFHYIRTNKYYGLSGGDRNYSLDIYPDCKLSRTAIRGKIDTDPKLCRALNITAEMCQMKNLWHHLDSDTLCTPKELYDDLKAQGYDWDVLLNTRGWWTLDNDMHPIPFLSTMDLLRMRRKEYFPYWMNEDKTVKTEKEMALLRKTISARRTAEVQAEAAISAARRGIRETEAA